VISWAIRRLTSTLEVNSMSETAAAISPARPEAAALTADKVGLRHPLVRALLVLTMTTGLIDACSYLGLGHVFTANQTGNSILLALGIVSSDHLPVLAPLVSLGCFLVGAGLGGLATRKAGARNITLVARALAINISLTGTAAIIVAVSHVTPNTVSAYIVIGLLALAMGVRNATIRRIGGTALTTTVLTGTLAALAADSPLAGGSGKGSGRHIASALALLIGAMIGGLLLKSSLALPLAAAAGLELVTLVVYVPAVRRRLT
jgi:uncharacterized membrane protein YoaK (UPF0700 family)